VTPIYTKHWDIYFYIYRIELILNLQDNCLKQNDTKTDELMMEDLGKYVIKNITGRTYWKSCSLQEGMRHRSSVI
jgi:hypothetical protein